MDARAPRKPPEAVDGQAEGVERVRQAQTAYHADAANQTSRSASPENVIQFPVAMARGSHLFPYRTQKLSLYALMVLGW
jgi:hypothetical protein